MTPPIPPKLHCLEGSFLTYLTGVSVTAPGLTLSVCCDVMLLTLWDLEGLVFSTVVNLGSAPMHDRSTY